MREIKFRAWDKEGNNYSNWKPQMVYQDEWSLKIESPGNLFPLPYNNERFEWMQSTGLHDKNGKEIFEGDIFRVEEQADDRMYYLVIHWIKEWCMFGCLTVGEYTAYLATGISALDEPMFWTYTLEDTDSQKFFLCGNIYQNANLLQL